MRFSWTIKASQVIEITYCRLVVQLGVEIDVMRHTVEDVW
jgi:hypothetical protein